MQNKEIKDTILKRLKEGESISHLSKEFALSKKLLYQWYEEVIGHDQKIRECGKEYIGYIATIEKKKGTPYDSKIGGVAYVAEGKEWVTCPNCNHRMVLVLQLNIKELPTVPQGLEEWDFLQVYTCMYPHDEKEDVLKCSQIEGYFGEQKEEKSAFNRTFQIELIKKSKKAQAFAVPPWLESYSLVYLEDENRVESNHNRLSFYNYKDKHDYSWVISHCKEGKVIVSWEKTIVPCRDEYDFHTMATFFNETYTEVEYRPMYACTTSQNKISDLLGIISDYELNNRALGCGENPNCLECGEYMTLLYQFTMFHNPFSEASSFEGEFDLATNDDWHRRFVNTFALYYCPKHPELMSCQWVNIEK